jgi:hypothetical protein
MSSLGIPRLGGLAAFGGFLDRALDLYVLGQSEKMLQVSTNQELKGDKVLTWWTDA